MYYLTLPYKISVAADVCQGSHSFGHQERQGGLHVYRHSDLQWRQPRLGDEAHQRTACWRSQESDQRRAQYAVGRQDIWPLLNEACSLFMFSAQLRKYYIQNLKSKITRMLKVRAHLASGWVDEGFGLLFVHSIFTSRNVRAFFSQIATRISNAFPHFILGRAAYLNVCKIVPKGGCN